MERSEKQFTRRRCLALMASAAAATRISAFCWGENDWRILRVAVSTETIAGTNIDDARAAYKVRINDYLINVGQTVCRAT